MAKDKKYILQESIVEKKLHRLALEIVEHNINEKSLIFVGIASSGVIVAKRLKKLVEAIADINIILTTLQLDKQMPDKITLDKEIDFNNKSIIVIDDVTNSGKTLLYSMKPFLEFHPKKIQTLVLVERSYTQFPVRADYKGFSLATTLQEQIVVEVTGEKITGAYLA